MVHRRARVGRVAAAAGLVVAVALALASCGGSSTTAATTSGVTTTTLPLTAANCPSLVTTTTAPPPGTASGVTTTTVARHPIFCRKGSASTVISGIKTPNVPNWKLVWHFDCTRVAGKKGAFSIVLHPSQKKPAIKVTSQKGLGGGGSNFYAPGDYSLSVSTACNWTVTGYS